MAKLKPQDFTGLAGKEITVSALKASIVKSIQARKDLDMNLRNYLLKLTEYVDGNAGELATMKKIYSKVEASDKNAIKKDFSEIIAALVIRNMPKSQRDKLNLTISAQSKVFIPTAGNYPLVDFMIKSSGGVVDNYSVKIMGKTTNTVKAQDVLETVSPKLKKKNPKETAILECVAENDAKLGPILALASIIDEMPVKNGPMKNKFKTLCKSKQIKNDVLKEQDVDWWVFFEPIMDKYYSKGKPTLAKAWKKGYCYDALTVLAQYSVADHTKDMNWGDFVDEIQKKVTYFKFDINTAGVPAHDVINGLSERKPGQKFRLRAKSRLKESDPSSRSGQDKLGIQP
jgi:hypothetical protein